jgi:hypothetical protein
MVVVVSPAISVSVICGWIVGETTTTICITTVLEIRVLVVMEMVVVAFPTISVSVICGRIVGETTTTISITTVLGLKVLGIRVLVVMEMVVVAFPAISVSVICGRIALIAYTLNVRDSYDKMYNQIVLLNPW